MQTNTQLATPAAAMPVWRTPAYRADLAQQRVERSVRKAELTIAIHRLGRMSNSDIGVVLMDLAGVAADSGMASELRRLWLSMDAPLSDEEAEQLL